MLNPASTSSETPGNGHLAFLSRAAHDPEFRAALEAKPEAIFADYGLDIGSSEIPSMVALPSAESILDILIDVEEDEDGFGKDQISWYGFLG